MSRTIERLITGDLPLDFNWNRDLDPRTVLTTQVVVEPSAEQASKVKIVAEDLRDGLHGVAEYPTADQMTGYIDSLNKLGVDIATVGIYPGESNKIDKAIKQVLASMRDNHPDMSPVVLSLTTPESLKWTIACKEINPNLQAIVFMGTAPSRLLVEEWERETILAKLGEATQTAVKHGVEVIGATEHTTQTPPDFLRQIVKTQVDNGASVFCIADTIGISRPIGTYRIVRYVRDILDEMGRSDVLIDWHGHRDMGNDVGNAMTAIAAGANRIHTVARGIGERAGNTQLKAVLLNCTAILDESGMKNPWNIAMLSEVLNSYSKIVTLAEPGHGPLSSRSHKSSLGIHTSAMLKAARLAEEAREGGHDDLAQKLEKMARTIYSAVDPQSVGKTHEIAVGPWSGTSTVQLAALSLGIDSSHVSKEATEFVLKTAKQLGRELSQDELIKLLKNGH